MSGIFLLLLAFLLILGLVIGLGIGVGSLLHWLFPDIELGMAILVGTAMLGLVLYLFVQIFHALHKSQLAQMREEWEEQGIVEIVTTPPSKRKRR